MTITTQSHQRENTAVAVSAIVFSVFALSLGDAIVKSVSVSMPLWQLYVLRSVLALPVLVVFIRVARARTRLMPVSVFWTSVRSLLLAVMWVAYYASLPHLQLSLAAAAYYTSPLFITLFSAAFAGERVGRMRWFAVALGFAGVVVMLRPDVDGFDAWALLPIAAAVCYAAAMILTRSQCRDESPLVLSAALNIAFILVGALASAILMMSGLPAETVSANRFLLGGWIGLGAPELAALGALAAAMLAGSIFAAIAYQRGASSTVSAFDYSYLAFSAVWGIVFFAERPDATSLAGIAMIATAGILAARRTPPPDMS